MRISDWSSDVCSSDLEGIDAAAEHARRHDLSEFRPAVPEAELEILIVGDPPGAFEQERFQLTRSVGNLVARLIVQPERSEEHTSELQSLMRISYAVFCLKTKNTNTLPLI